MPEIVFAPNRAEYPGGNRRDDLESWFGQRFLDSWTCKRSAKKGDLYLFYFGTPENVVCAVGVSNGTVKVERNKGADWTDNPRLWFCGFKPLLRLDVPITMDDIRSDSVLAKWWKGRPFQGRSKAIRPQYAERLLVMMRHKNRHRPMLCSVLSQYSSQTRTGFCGTHTSEKVAKQAQPLAIDIAKPPGRKACIEHRIIRDTPLARTLKDMYEGRCQLCGKSLRLPKGLVYCEAHHLRPLGGRHKGKDHHGNMVVVCPRCHAELDFLAIAIHPRTLRIATCWAKHPLRSKKLRTDANHLLDSASLRYHWKLYQTENGA